MDLTSIDFGATTIPVFIATFAAGWTACRVYLVKPLERRVEVLEARDEAYRKDVDEQLRAYRSQRVLG